MRNKIKIMLVILLIIILLVIYGDQAIAQPYYHLYGQIEVQEVITERESIDNFLFLMSLKYDIDYKEIKTVIQCESGFNPKAINPNEAHTDGTTDSWGIAQFNRRTFDTWADEINLENGDPMNYQHALEVMAYAFSQGESYKKHWSCWKKFYK